MITKMYAKTKEANKSLSRREDLTEKLPADKFSSIDSEAGMKAALEEDIAADPLSTAEERRDYRKIRALQTALPSIHKTPLLN